MNADEANHTVHADMRALENSSGRCIGLPKRARRDDFTHFITRCATLTSCGAPGRRLEPIAGCPGPMA